MKFLFFFAFLFVISELAAQDTLTLQTCFDNLEKSKFSLVSENSTVSTAKVNMNYHKLTALPNLNANSNSNAGFGRILDPVSNQFSTSQVNSQSFGLNSSVTLFNGFGYYHQRNKLSLIHQQAITKYDQSLNGLFLDVIPMFVELCLKQAQLELSDLRLKQLNNLLAVQRILYQNGKITQVDTLRAHNLVMKEQTEQFLLKQTFRTTEIRLNMRMGRALDDRHFYDVNSIESITHGPQPNEAYALQSIAIEQEMIRVEEKLARSSIVPSLALSGSLGTRYSTALKEDPFDFQSAPMSYRNQMDVNLFQNIGFQLSIPIFSNGEYLKNAQLRKIKEDELLMQSESITLDLERKNMEFNLLFSSTLSRCQQIETSTKNLELIYNLTVESYKSGRTTFSELEDIFIEWQTEVLNLKSAKYELIRLRLLEVRL